MERENNSMDPEEAKKAEELSQKISSIIYSTRCWEHHPGNPELLKKLLRAVEEVESLLYRLGLIENCGRLSDLSRESENGVNRVLEIVFDLIIKKNSIGRKW